MEFRLLHADLCQLFVAHLDSSGIAGSVQLRLDAKRTFRGQSGLGGGVGNQIHDYFMAHQRFAPPVPSDAERTYRVAKHAMLNLVPLAGTGWKMADREAQSGLVG